MSVMKASELVKKHIDVAKNYKTVYMWGCFGSPVSEGIIAEKAKQYPDWYTAAKQARFRGLIGKPDFPMKKRASSALCSCHGYSLLLSLFSLCCFPQKMS